MLSFLGNLAFSVTIALSWIWITSHLNLCYSFLACSLLWIWTILHSPVRSIISKLCDSVEREVFSMSPDGLSRQIHRPYLTIQDNTLCNPSLETRWWYFFNLQWSSTHSQFFFPIFQRYFTHYTFSMKPLPFLLIEKSNTLLWTTAAFMIFSQIL